MAEAPEAHEPFALRVRATCPLHPLERAVDLCSRCGRFVCTECITSIAGDVLCTECAGRPRPPDRVPPRVVIAVLVAFAGVLVPGLGPVALVMALRERRLLRRGASPEVSRQWVETSTKVAVLGTVVTFAWAASWVASGLIVG